jgi:hypothetical protein
MKNGEVCENALQESGMQLNNWVWVKDYGAFNGRRLQKSSFCTTARVAHFERQARRHRSS